MPIDQGIIQIFQQPYILSNITIQSYFAKNSCIKHIKVLLIVAIDSFTFPVDLMCNLVQNLRFSLDIL